MSTVFKKYKPLHRGVSVCDKDAFGAYKDKGKKSYKNINSIKEYRKILRGIYKNIAESSVTYESGVYLKDYFYLVPQVICNQPFIQQKDGKLKSTYMTDGNIYSPVFCNLMIGFDKNMWSIEGTYVDGYRERLSETIIEYVPEYRFILNSLVKSNV